MPLNSIHLNNSKSDGGEKSKVSGTTNLTSLIMENLSPEGRKHFKEVSAKRKASINLKTIALTEIKMMEMNDGEKKINENCPESPHSN